MEVSSPEEHSHLDVAVKDFQKMSSDMVQEGMREGFTVGREKGLQEGFDLGYQTGFNVGFQLGSNNGRSRALSIIKKNEESLSNLIPKPERGACVLCPQDGSASKVLMAKAAETAEQVDSIIERQMKASTELLSSLKVS